MRTVWEKFKKVPGVLQRQIIQRMGLSGFMLFLSVIIWITSSDLALTLPGLALMVYLGISGSLLLYRGIGGGYICVAGTVKQVEVNGWRKKATPCAPA